MTRPHIAFAMCRRVFCFKKEGRKEDEETMATQFLTKMKKNEKIKDRGKKYEKQIEGITG